jgi:hypothetical protein
VVEENQKKKKKTVTDLRTLMTASDTADKFLFSEQRSNILLIAGEHYTKRNSKYWNRLRESKNLSQDQKLRLTKNHIQKIQKLYVNAMLNHAPGVRVLPNNEKENADRKSAVLNNSVWQYAVSKYKLTEKIARWADDFCGIGEVFLKITWDDQKGELTGYDQKVDDNGQPMFEQGPVDPMTGQQMQGQPVADENSPVFSGEFEFKRLFGFNIRRPNGVQDLDDAEWLAEVDLVPVKKVKSWVEDPEIKRKIVEDTHEKFYVFDGNMNGYDQKKDHTKVTSMYYRPGPEHPNGYYYIFTDSVILFEGELPFGIFPIVYKGFDAIQTSPRHRSIIKQLRPYQVEINRCASKIAEHQVSLGDDKLLVQSGTKITQGINHPGIRALQYTGREPIILAGRSGEQYAGYMQSQIEEMYNVANIPMEAMEKAGGQDAFASLFHNLRQKKKFSLYAERFERFLMDVCELYLTLAKNYFEEGRVIPMVGKSEWVNIAEFKNTEPLNYQIKLEPQVQDIETQYGKQLVMNHALQYVGSNLEKGEIGRMMRAMPFGNMEEGFEDFTLDYDLAQNLLLALDRGEQPEPSPYDEPTYMIKMLVNRIRQPDFKLLDPQIQQNYMQYKQWYELTEAEQQRKILAAQADFIPSGGPKVKVDFYVPKPGSPDKSERATIPAESLNWLVERLSDQGSSQDRLGELEQGSVADVAGAYLQQSGKPKEDGEPTR